MAVRTEAIQKVARAMTHISNDETSTLERTEKQLQRHVKTLKDILAKARTEDGKDEILQVFDEYVRTYSHTFNRYIIVRRAIKSLRYI